MFFSWQNSKANHDQPVLRGMKGTALTASKLHDNHVIVRRRFCSAATKWASARSGDAGSKGLCSNWLTNQPIVYMSYLLWLYINLQKRSNHIETYVFIFLVALIICSVLPFWVYVIDFVLFLQSRVFSTRFIQELNPKHPIQYTVHTWLSILCCIVLCVSPRQLHSMCGKPNARNHPQATQWLTIWGILKPWPYPKRVFVTFCLHCYRPFPTVYDKVRGVMRQRRKP